MFGVGAPEMVVIGLLLLVVFGPNKLPGMARDIGRFVSEARRSVDEFKKDLVSEGEVGGEPHKGRGSGGEPGAGGEGQARRGRSGRPERAPPRLGACSWSVSEPTVRGIRLDIHL